MAEDANDLDVVDRARLGDKVAWEILYRRHERYIYLLILRLVRGNVPIAEDLHQEAFLKAWHSLKYFRGECEFVHWLRKIAIHVTFNHLRKEKNKPTLSMTDILEPVSDEGESAKSIEQSIDQQQRADRLEKAIRSLPDQQRIAITLRLAGHSYAEVAEAMDVSLGTVKSTLSHAAHRILKELRNDLPFNR